MTVSRNQRCHARMKVGIEVTVTDAKETVHKAVTRDMSDGGLFVRMAIAGIQVGDWLVVQVSGPIGSGQAADPVRMQVMRIEPDGLGLRFSNC